MYNKVTYKFPLVLLILFIGFCSCDSIKSKNDLLKESISEFRDSIEPVEVVKYYPKAYNEVVKDSILSNGFKVKIRTFTNMSKFITKTSNYDMVVYKNHYRQIESDLIVFKGDKEIFKEKINNTFLLKYLPKSDNIKDYVGNDIYINQEATLKTNTLVLIASLYKPKSNNCISYNIIIHENGHFQIKEIDKYARA